MITTDQHLAIKESIRQLIIQKKIVSYQDMVRHYDSLPYPNQGTEELDKMSREISKLKSEALDVEGLQELYNRL